MQQPAQLPQKRVARMTRTYPGNCPVREMCARTYWKKRQFSVEVKWNCPCKMPNARLVGDGSDLQAAGG